MINQNCQRLIQFFQYSTIFLNKIFLLHRVIVYPLTIVFNIFIQLNISIEN